MSTLAICTFCEDIALESKVNSDNKGRHCATPACRDKALKQFCNEPFIAILPLAESHLSPLLVEESDPDRYTDISSGEESF